MNFPTHNVYKRNLMQATFTKIASLNLKELLKSKHHNIIQTLIWLKFRCGEREGWGKNIFTSKQQLHITWEYNSNLFITTYLYTVLLTPPSNTHPSLSVYVLYTTRPTASKMLTFYTHITLGLPTLPFSDHF